jgi:NADPH-dependent curcumin reductase CurA
VGSKEKKDWITKQLNFDHGVVYKEKDWEKNLENFLIETNKKRNSVEVYFDNVGKKKTKIIKNKYKIQ